MSVINGKYDEVLTSILVDEKSILGFLSTIFNFLARRYINCTCTTISDKLTFVFTFMKVERLYNAVFIVTEA